MNLHIKDENSNDHYNTHKYNNTTTDIQELVSVFFNLSIKINIISTLI